MCENGLLSALQLTNPSDVRSCVCFCRSSNRHNLTTFCFEHAIININLKCKSGKFQHSSEKTDPNKQKYLKWSP